MSTTPYMMSKDMQYGGVLVLSVAGVKDNTIGKKAVAALRKVEGVAKVTVFPQQEAVGVEFTSKGKATSKQLLDALKAAGLQGAQYVSASGPRDQAMNGGNGPLPGHAGMTMDNGAMTGHGAMSHVMACGCAACMQTSSGTRLPYRAQSAVYYGA